MFRGGQKISGNFWGEFPLEYNENKIYFIYDSVMNLF